MPTTHEHADKLTVDIYVKKGLVDWDDLDADTDLLEEATGCITDGVMAGLRAADDRFQDWQVRLKIDTNVWQVLGGELTCWTGDPTEAP